MAAHPGLLKETQYRVVVHEEVWELKHAYRETCLCRICFNLRCYREALKVLYQILLVLAEATERDSAPSEGDEADDANLQEQPDAQTPAPDPKLKALIAYCESNPGRRRKVCEMICADRLEDAEGKCIRQECDKCPNFAKIWSCGLRPELVDAYGKLKCGVSPAWSQQLQWSRIKRGGDGSSKEDDLRQTCEGTMIQLLDEYEPVEKVNIRHAFHIEQSRDAEGEFSRNSIPGIIDCKSDYSENGSLEKPKQLQQEYWVIIYYTLLISIASFLVSSVWRECATILPVGAEVTVEPADYLPPADGTIEAVKGSYWARVEISTDGSGQAIEYIEGEDVEYTVRSFENAAFNVRRSQLRHRKRHRIAFLQITNEKKHDLFSSSAFATKRQEFFQRWHESGHTSATEWARNDRAEQQRKEAEAAAKAEAAAAAATTTTNKPSP